MPERRVLSVSIQICFRGPYCCITIYLVYHSLCDVNHHAILFVSQITINRYSDNVWRHWTTFRSAPVCLEALSMWRTLEHSLTLALVRMVSYMSRPYVAIYFQKEGPRWRSETESKLVWSPSTSTASESRWSCLVWWSRSVVCSCSRWGCLVWWSRSVVCSCSRWGCLVWWSRSVVCACASAFHTCF